MGFKYRDELISGAVGATIGVIITYGVSFAIPTSDLSWALIAVGAASFFSGFFSRHYAERK